VRPTMRPVWDRRDGPPLTFMNARLSGLNSDWLFAELTSMREADTSKQIVETRVWA
jgi:hypothetical protein